VSRIRRVKCDEAKPACNKCTSTGRKCDGYSSLPFSRRDLHAASKAFSEHSSSGDDLGLNYTAPLARIVTDPAFSDILEKRYFQFFRQKTVASTNSLMACRFWDRIVLQICHVEPAVKHAILALSSLHQLSDARSNAELAQKHQDYADYHHHKALVAAQKLLSSSTAEDIDRVLIACVVFICYDNVRGNYRTAAIHTHSGRSILAQHRTRLKRLARRNDLAEIEQLFGRLDISAITFSEQGSKYAYRIDDFFSSSPKLVPDDFTTIDEARAPLVDHVRWTLLLGGELHEAERADNVDYLVALDQQRVMVITHLQQWLEHFESIVAKEPYASRSLISTLRLWHASAQLQLATIYEDSEMRFDAFHDIFACIVEYAEAILALLAKQEERYTFSFDLGISIPLFMVAQRCRDPHLRRRAIALMRTESRQEGAWESVGAADVVERWMLAEEAGLLSVQCAADVPEGNRMETMEVAVNTDKGTARVVFNMTPKKEQTEDDSAKAMQMRRDLTGAWRDRPWAADVQPFSMGMAPDAVEQHIRVSDARMVRLDPPQIPRDTFGKVEMEIFDEG